jgi:hypothetical protein
MTNLATNKKFFIKLKKKGTVLLPDQIDGLDCDPWTDGWRTCGEREPACGPGRLVAPAPACEHGARPAGARRRVPDWRWCVVCVRPLGLRANNGDTRDGETGKARAGVARR